jgi:pimeloyl-ACP methyl ester carboxylesterase
LCSEARQIDNTPWASRCEVSREPSKGNSVDSLVRDGVKLAFEQRGEGDPGIVFIHGWCCDHTFFEPQMDHFSRNHRVVTVDRRGHGESDKPEGSYHPDVFAEDIAWLIDQLGLTKPVVVGHSMGGVVALRLAHLFPESVSALIALDAGWVLPSIYDEAGPAVSAALTQPDYQDQIRAVMGSMMLDSDDPARRQRFLDTMSSAPQRIMHAEWQETIEHTDTATPLEELQVPALYIAAQEPLGDLARIRAAGVTIGQTVGSGHFHQFEVPDQVNSMMERFIALNVPTPAR